MRKTYPVVAISITLLCILASSAFATTYYVDSSVASSGNGRSWATAWKNFSNITGLQPGDTVYISGGTTSQTYTLNSWMPPSGTSGGEITYAVGQNAGHNGTVIFQGGTSWLGGGSGAINYVTIQGLGSDGTNRMTVQGYSDYTILCVSGTTCSHLSLQQINFLNEKGGFRFDNSGGTDIGFNVINKVYFGSDGTHDDVMYWCQESSVGAWDCLVHDNFISIQANASQSACGDDGIKWGQGMAVYNNHFKVNLSAGYSGNLGTCQHSDMMQIHYSRFRIYNNLFEDIGESWIYHDIFDSVRSVSDIYIYNNIFTETHSAGTTVARGIDILPESAGTGSTLTNVIIANNDFVDTDGLSYILRAADTSDGGFATCTNCRWQNNIDYNNVGNYHMSPQVTQSNNSTGATFVNHVHFAGSANDLHLASSDTFNKGLGINLSTYFTTDRDSNTRTGTWDIGGYEYGSGITAVSPPAGLVATVQ